MPDTYLGETTSSPPRPSNITRTPCCLALSPWNQQARLPKPYNFKASPLGAGGKLYLVSEQGDVGPHGGEF